MQSTVDPDDIVPNDADFEKTINKQFEKSDREKDPKKRNVTFHVTAKEPELGFQPKSEMSDKAGYVSGDTEDAVDLGF
jgi:hypothetical protein